MYYNIIFFMNGIFIKYKKKNARKKKKKTFIEPLQSICRPPFPQFFLLVFHF